MQCPKCGKTIFHVNVYSEYYQKGHLAGDSNVIGGYSDGEVLEVEDIECPECYEAIADFIEEE